jgi:chitodextrinase
VRKRPQLALVAALLVIAPFGAFPGSLPSSAAAAVSAGTVASSDPVIAVAGDIACDPANSNFNGGNGSANSCRQKYTSDLLVNSGLSAVLDLGDNQYYCSGYQAYLGSYDLSWGRAKPITHPSVGNHVYLTSGGTDCNAQNAGADGYFKYFGAAAGQKGSGYYSFDVGTWHLIALNSNCHDAGGCGATSPQGLWLANDLRTHTNFCTLAFWHIPLFSSGGRANGNSKPFWQMLYDNNADLILSAHDHTYERFAPQTPSGTLDTARGIREFIAGTGGANHTGIVQVAANSEVRNVDTFGVLELTLHAASYDWQFAPEAGKTFTDAGTTACHGASPDTSPPTAPAGLVATAQSTGQVDLSWTASADNVGVTGYQVYRDGTFIGSTAATTYSDTTVSGSTTYSYTVAASDAAGNHSPPSAPASVTTPGGTASVLVNPVADTYADSSNPATTHGSSAQLRIDGSPTVSSYLRFDLSSVPGTITGLTLNVYATSSSTAGYAVRGVADNTWSESTLNWNNAPAIGSTDAGQSGAFTANTMTAANVSSLISGNGLLSLSMMGINGTAVSFSSREGAVKPQLVVTYQN